MFSERLLLFFGIHTANAAILAAREMARSVKKAALESSKRELTEMS
jgi:hypothetical protein